MWGVQLGKTLNFEESLNRLEEITNTLEKGDVNLDIALQIFEEGIKLSRFCEKKLTEAEHKVEILRSTDITNDDNDFQEVIKSDDEDKNDKEESNEIKDMHLKKKVKSKKSGDETGLLF